MIARLLLAVVVVSCTNAFASNNAKIAEFSDEVAEFALENGIIGLNIAIAQKGKVVFKRGYGLRDKESNEAMTSEAVMDYFSVGKHLTTVLLLNYVQEGRLELDSAVSKYISSADFGEKEPTIRQLLNHTSGFWDMDDGFLFMGIEEWDPPEVMLRAPSSNNVLALAKKGQNVTRPGESWSYSDAGYMFAGLVAEAISGQPFDVALHKHIIDELNLPKFAHCSYLVDERSPSYLHYQGTASRFPLVEPRWFGGAGAICGTASELINWWLTLRSGKVLTSKYLESMLSPANLKLASVKDQFEYGLGLRIGQFGPYKMIGHTGSGIGGTAFLAELPQKQLVVAVLLNTMKPEGVDATEIGTRLISKLSQVSRDIEPKGEPKESFLAKLPGRYRSSLGELCVRVKDRQVQRSFGDDNYQPLIYAGNNRFISSLKSSSFEYFIGSKHSKAQWFALNDRGFPQDLAFRVADSCDL